MAPDIGGTYTHIHVKSADGSTLTDLTLKYASGNIISKSMFWENNGYLVFGGGSLYPSSFVGATVSSEGYKDFTGPWDFEYTYKSQYDTDNYDIYIQLKPEITKPTTTEGKIEYIYNAYKDIKSAIEEKGGSVGSDISEYAEGIRNIKGEKNTVTYSGILGQYASGAQATGLFGDAYYIAPTIPSGSTISFSFEVPKNEIIRFLNNYEANSDKEMSDYVSNKDWNLGVIGTRQASMSSAVGGGVVYTIFTNSNTTGTWAEVFFDEVEDSGTLVVNAPDKSFGGVRMDDIKITLSNNGKEVSFNWEGTPSYLKINYYFD